MMVSVQTTAGLERRMEVLVPAARVQQAVEERLRDFGRTAKLQGFRPGKVPISVIRQRFGTQVRSEVVEDLVRRSFAEAVTEQKLNPANGPRIEQLISEQGQDLKYAAVFEVYPKVELKGLDTLAVDRPTVEVSDADIAAMLEHLRGQRPNWKAAGRASRKGDRVTLDFEGRIDGTPFAGGAATDFPIVLGAGQMLPDFESGLDGVEAGAEKVITVRFPDDYQAKELAGKTSEFTLKIKAVEEPELPALDEEFCKLYGITEGGVDELRRQIGENMRSEVEQTTRARMKTQILDRLLEANPLELPNSLVDSQVSDMQLDLARRHGLRDISQIPPRENFLEAARRRVALGLLINELIALEKIELDRNKVQSRLAEIVSSMENPQEMLQRYRQNAQAMQQVEALVLEDQVVDSLLARAKQTDRPQSFKEFTQFGA